MGLSVTLSFGNCGYSSPIGIYFQELSPWAYFWLPFAQCLGIITSTKLMSKSLHRNVPCYTLPSPPFSFLHVLKCPCTAGFSCHRFIIPLYTHTLLYSCLHIRIESKLLQLRPCYVSPNADNIHLHSTIGHQECYPTAVLLISSTPGMWTLPGFPLTRVPQAYLLAGLPSC